VPQPVEAGSADRAAASPGFAASESHEPAAAQDAPASPASETHEPAAAPDALAPLTLAPNYQTRESSAPEEPAAELPEIAARAADEVSLKPRTWEEAVNDGMVVTPVLDPQRLETASMGNPELKEMLVKAFLTQTPQRLEKLRDAIVAGNAADVEFEAHSMKGMCATLGAQRCAEVFEHMERLAAQKRLEPLPYKLQRAEIEVQRVEEMLGAPPAKAA
jgi:HPt (histidine-containing phosphotransfer) domain-containing protein